MLFTFRVVEKRSLNYKWSVYSGQRSIAFELAIFTLIRTKRTKICFKILGKKIIYINMSTYIYIYIYVYISCIQCANILNLDIVYSPTPFT